MLKVIAVAVFALLFAAGCASGQSDAPTPAELQRDGVFFDLQDTNGTLLRCHSYSGRGDDDDGNRVHWFNYTCWPAVTTQPTASGNEITVDPG